MSDTASEAPAQTGGLRTWILLAAILVMALGLRLISLSQEALWYDELMIVQYLDSPNVVQFVRDALPRTPVPPGFMISEYLWSRVAGTDVVALRVWPLLCGIAGLGVLFAIARRLLGARTALFTILWVSFLYWHIHYSQEIRYYPLASLLSLLSMWTFIQLVNAPNRKWLALHMLLNAAMVWTHPITVFLCAAQFAFLLLFRRNHPRMVAAWTGLHLLLGATLYAFLASLNQEAAFAQAAWINPPTLWGRPPSVRNLVSMFSGVITLTPTNSWGERLLAIEPYTAAALMMLHVVLGAIGVRQILRASPDKPGSAALSPRETTALLLLWLVLPPFLVFVVSHVWKPMFVVRYVLFASIPLYILLAQVLATRPKWIAGAAFALLLTHDALFYFPGPTRIPFDQLAATIQRQSTAQPIIYLDDMLGMPPIEYYWHGPTPEFRPPTKRDEVFSQETRPEGADIWLVYTSEQRFETAKESLAEAGLSFDAGRLRASKPAWLIHLH